MSEHILSYRPAPSKQLYSIEYSFFLGLSDLSQGRIDSAKSRLKEMEALMSRIDPMFGSRVAHYDFRLLHGEVLLTERAFNEAISLFAAEESWEIPYMHSWVILLYNTPYPRDVAAKIYRKRGDLDSAIVEYERLIEFNPKSKEAPDPSSFLL